MVRELIAMTASAMVLAACAETSVMPLAKDTIRISTTGDDICGEQGAQMVALRTAAVESIRRGYDSFIIVGAGGDERTRLIGITPVTAQTNSAATVAGSGSAVVGTGNSTTTYSGGVPMYSTEYRQGLTVRMFHAGDPEGANALSARETLGSGWEKLVATTGTYSSCP